jgi:hypothetical protein
MSTIQSSISKGFSATTLKHSKTSKTRLLNFLNDKYGKKEWNLDSINYTFINDFDVYLKNGIKSLRSWRRAELSSCGAG